MSWPYASPIVSSPPENTNSMHESTFSNLACFEFGYLLAQEHAGYNNEYNCEQAFAQSSVDQDLPQEHSRYNIEYSAEQSFAQGNFEQAVPQSNTGDVVPQNNARDINQGNSDIRVCPICQISIPKRLLFWHVENTHFIDNLPQCQQCGLILSGTWRLLKHYETQHTVAGRNRSFPCPLEDCYKVYKNESSRDIHYRNTHTGEKDYMCGYCDKEFARLNALKVHLNNKHPFDGADPFMKRLN